MHRVMPRLTLAQAGSGALHSQQFPFPSNPKICPKTSRPPWEPPKLLYGAKETLKSPMETIWSQDDLMGTPKLTLWGQRDPKRPHGDPQTDPTGPRGPQKTPRGPPNQLFGAEETPKDPMETPKLTLWGRGDPKRLHGDPRTNSLGLRGPQKTPGRPPN